MPPVSTTELAASASLPQLYVDRASLIGTSRLTVAFRLILALPHLVVLYVLSLAAVIVALVAWFAALFTGRVPEGMYGFLAWFVTYAVRVYAYLGLLTDRWPTFGGADPYPVQVWLPGPEGLNRAAVFFRFLLAIPAAIVASLVATGASVAAVVIWLIVLIKGRVPRAVFNAVASVARYQLRYSAYVYLLTTAYPAGLFGDPADRRAHDDLPDSTAVTGAARPPVVHASARRLLVTFVVIGLLGLAAQIAGLILLVRSAVDRAHADQQLANAYRGIHAADIGSCVSAADALSCFKRSTAQDAEAFSTFSTEVDDIDFPGDVEPLVVAVQRADQRLVTDFRALSQVPSLAAYRAFTSSHDLRAEGQALDDAVVALGRALERAPS